MAKRKRRNFTPEFKGKVVLEALRCETSQAELCRQYDLSKDQLSKWKQQAIEKFTSTDTYSSEALERSLSSSSSFRIKDPHNTYNNTL